ncbi:MAG: hypothetical protein IKP69_06490 [Oscillospiraceae bacterium]|nr:hypothetical protein [Oscillospiraceae bacterium]
MKYFDTAAIKAHFKEYAYSHLKKDKNGFIICPCCGSGTHKNGTPALKIYDENGYCHSCGKYYDDIELHMKLNNMSFKQAVQELGEEFHLQPIPKPPKQKWELLREHVYSDASGNTLAKKSIFKKSDGNKTGVWYLFDSETGEFRKKTGLDKKKMPLYHANKLHDSPETTVYFTEGEKDVETLENAYGLTVTCTPNGASQTTWHNIYNADLSGKDIIIITDNDSAGKNYGNTVAKNLYPIANSVKIVPSESIWDKCPEKGDISDIIQALGEEETEQRLSDAIAKADFYNPKQAETDDSTDLPNWILETNRGLKVSPELLARHIQDTEHYYLVQQKDKEEQRFFWYQDGIYSRISTALVKSRIREIISEYGIKLATVPAIENTYKQLTYPEKKHYLSSDTLLDADENIIVFQNGVLQLDTLELKPYSPNFKVTRKIPCNWNPDAPHKNLLFDSYILHLAGNDADCAKTLIEAIGFAISNVKISHYKAGIVLYGSGNTGKTMFLKFIKKLIGEENYCSMPFENLSKRFSISKLYKKRFAADDDCNYCSRANISYYKSMTSGAPMDFEEKGKDATTFEYDGLYFICANKLPLFSGDKGEHVYERIIPIKCGDSIPKSKRDDKLLDKLYAEREAIVFAAVMALKTTISRGHKFTVSATSEMLLQEFKQENDIVYQFIAECCEPLHKDKNFDVTAQSLYIAFGNWCEEEGEHYRMKKSEFKQSLANYLHTDEKNLIVHTNHGDYYQITLTENGKAECHVK